MTNNSDVDFMDLCNQLALGNKTAFEQIKRLAEEGNLEAQYHLSGCYYGDKFVKKDLMIAQKWMLNAAEMGYPLAQHAIGQNYADGSRGFEQNDELAVQWWQKAAKNGSVISSIVLRTFAQMGRGKTGG